MNTEDYEMLVQAILARFLRRAMEPGKLSPTDVKDVAVSPEELGSAAVRAATILQQYYAKARARAGSFDL
jgi:hypothetical protein